MTTKKHRIELVFGVRDEDLYNWMVENNLFSSPAIKNILRTQMILGGKQNVIVTPKTEKTEVKEPENKVGFGGIGYKKM